MTKKRIRALDDILETGVKTYRRKSAVREIRDEDEIASIFREYKRGDIFMLVNKIKVYSAKCEYGEGECFKDLLLYLRKVADNDILSSGYYKHILELYEERISIYNEFIIFYLNPNHGKETN